MKKMKTTVGFKVKRLLCPLDSGRQSRRKKLLHFLKKQKLSLEREQLEREIYSSCILLKNLAIVYRNFPMSVDFILEQLMEGSRRLGNIYADILSAYRNGKGEAAFLIFYERVPTRNGRLFAGLLAKLEQINPSELVDYMGSFSETFAEERMTREMKRAERKSLIVTMVSTATIFVILLNFTIVVVFMDTLRILREMM